MYEGSTEQVAPITSALWESWPGGYECRRADPVPTQLQDLGEWAQHTEGVVEPQGCERGKAGSTTCLVCGNVSE